MEQKSAIQKAIRSSNLNTVIIAAVVLVSLVALVGVSAKTLYNHFFGPFDVANEELISIQGPGDTFRTYVEAWYEGKFQDVVFSAHQQTHIREMLSSILAGYAWDTRNPFVQNSKKRLTN